jgi:hypothetical protein
MTVHRDAYRQHTAAANSLKGRAHSDLATPTAKQQKSMLAQAAKHDATAKTHATKFQSHRVAAKKINEGLATRPAAKGSTTKKK